MSWGTTSGSHFLAQNPPLLSSNFRIYNAVSDYGCDPTGVADSGAKLQSLPSNIELFFPPQAGAQGSYLISTTITPVSNQSFRAIPGTVVLKRTTVGNIFASTTGIDRIGFLGLEFDLTTAASSAILLSGADGAGKQVTNLTIRDSRFRNPSNTWLLQIVYTIPDPSLPVSKNLKLRIEDCEFDGTGQTGSLENVIVMNSQDVLVDGCRFTGSGASTPAQLALYGYDRDCRVVATHFENFQNTATYIQQSDSISYQLCEWRSTFNSGFISIKNSKDITIANNPVMVATNLSNCCELKDFGPGTFDGHTNLYNATTGVHFKANRCDAVDHVFVIDCGLAQGQSDVYVDDNIVSPLRNLFRVVNVPAAPSATCRRWFIRGNEAPSQAAIDPAGFIEITGNAAATLGGISSVYIEDNLIAGTGEAFQVRNKVDDVTITGNKVLTSGTKIVVTTDLTNFRCFDNPGMEVQSPAFAASYTPDISQGQVINLGALTAGLTINAPTPGLADGQEVEFLLLQDGTGGRATAWNAAYVQSWSDTGNTLNKRSSIKFRSVGGTLYQVGAQRAWA